MQDNDLQEFGGRLLRLMAINSISETEIFLQLSIAQDTYDGWVTNSMPPSEMDIAMLVGYFGCNRHWLTSGEGGPYASSVEPGRETDPVPSGAIYLKDPAMLEMAEWVAEQDDGIKYWEVVKAKLAREYPEFREWLKKRRQD